MEIQWSEEYLVLKTKYIEEQYSYIPPIYRNKHYGRYVIQYYEGGRRHEVQPTSPRYQQLEYKYLRRKALKNELKVLYSMCMSRQNYKIRDDIHKVLDYNDYQKMVSNTSNSDGKHPYQHKEFYMRSRFEVSMAYVLDSLGLDYKYEPTIYLGDYMINPDFVVYLPEFDCCIIIECEGMTNRVGYVNRNGMKFTEYLYSGLVFGMTLVVLQGTDKQMPSPEIMRNAVVSAINNVTAMYVLKE